MTPIDAAWPPEACMDASGDSGTPRWVGTLYMSLVCLFDVVDLVGHAIRHMIGDMIDQSQRVVALPQTRCISLVCARRHSGHRCRYEAMPYSRARATRTNTLHQATDRLKIMMDVFSVDLAANEPGAPLTMYGKLNHLGRVVHSEKKTTALRRPKKRHY